MSSFTTPADVRLIGDFKFELLAKFEYHVDELPSLDVIEVPVGFVTDLASVPRIFWTILPPHGQYAKAAIVHDYLYAHVIGSKRYADDVFLQAMEVLGVAHWRRTLMYWAVRWFGKGNYQN